MEKRTSRLPEKMARTKRVTDPLDDRVKNRIFGLERPEPLCFSSGSEHSGHNDDADSSSSSFSGDLLYGFLPGGDNYDNEDDIVTPPENDSDSEQDFTLIDRTDEITGVLHRVLLRQNSDKFRCVLLANVYKSMEIFSFFKSNKSLLRRNVMLYLRNLGYNAAICKTKWESSGGLSAGNYEFIDVIKPHSAGTRYFIDLDFYGEFEIARQTNQYRQLLQFLPRVFIGECEDLKKIIKSMGDAAKRSLKSRGLNLPPWRKNRFVQNKYFGPYRRTVNFNPANLFSFSTSATKPTLGVECRTIGFDAVNEPPLLSAASRTR